MVANIPDRANIPTMELLVSLLRQSVVREDKKVTCVFCALLLWFVLPPLFAWIASSSSLLLILTRVYIISVLDLVSLAANSTLAADSLREHGAISDLSIVMAKYPADEGIVQSNVASSFAAVRIKQIWLYFPCDY